jgi:hypothetical protein
MTILTHDVPIASGDSGSQQHTQNRREAKSQVYTSQFDQ